MLDSCSMMGFVSSGTCKLNASKKMSLISINACFCLYSFLSISCCFFFSSASYTSLIWSMFIVLKSSLGMTISSSSAGYTYWSTLATLEELEPSADICSGTISVLCYCVVLVGVPIASKLINVWIASCSFYFGLSSFSSSSLPWFIIVIRGGAL